MFEPLEPPEEIVARRGPLLMYSAFGLAGLVFLGLGLRRHGLAQPFRLIAATLMLLLSLTWFAATLRSGAGLTNRTLRIRNIILLLLLVAHETPSLYQ
jgi:hypothetical protein